MNRIVELESQLVADICEFAELKCKIVQQLEVLPEPKWVDVLYKRYVEYKPLWKIATEMEYTYTYARTLHGRTLKNFQKK